MNNHGLACDANCARLLDAVAPSLAGVLPTYYLQRLTEKGSHLAVVGWGPPCVLEVDKAPAYNLAGLEWMCYRVVIDADLMQKWMPVLSRCLCSVSCSSGAKADSHWFYAADAVRSVRNDSYKLMEAAACTGECALNTELPEWVHRMMAGAEAAVFSSEDVADGWQLNVSRTYRANPSRRAVRALLLTAYCLKQQAAANSEPEASPWVVIDHGSCFITAGSTSDLLMASFGGLWFCALEMKSLYFTSMPARWPVSGLASKLPCQLLNGKPRPFMAASLLRGAQSRFPPPYVQSELNTQLPPAPVHMWLGTGLGAECGVAARVGLLAIELTQHDAAVVSESWAASVKCSRVATFNWPAGVRPPAAGTAYHPCSNDPGSWSLPDGCKVIRVQQREGTQTRVTVDCTTQLECGDKIATAHGGKHVITIAPDSAMPVVDGKALDMLISPAGLLKRQATGLLLEAACNEVLSLGVPAGGINYMQAAEATSLLHKAATWRGKPTSLSVLTVSLFVLPHRARNKLLTTDMKMAAPGQRNVLGQISRKGAKLASCRIGAMETEVLAAAGCYRCLEFVHSRDSANVPYCPSCKTLHSSCLLGEYCSIAQLIIPKPTYLGFIVLGLSSLTAVIEPDESRSSFLLSVAAGATGMGSISTGREVMAELSRGRGTSLLPAVVAFRDTAPPVMPADSAEKCRLCGQGSEEHYHLSSLTGNIMLPPSKCWTVDEESNRMQSDTVGREIVGLSRAVTRQLGREQAHSHSEAVESSYLHAFDYKRKKASGRQLQRAVMESSLHPLTKTLASTKQGVTRRWTKGKSVWPSMRAVIVPVQAEDHQLICLPEAAMACMGLAPNRQLRVLCNRAPSISLTSIQPVRAISWPHMAIGISPRLIPNMQGDYDGDELSVWVMPDECIDEAFELISAPCQRLREADALAAEDPAAYSICAGLGDVLTAKTQLIPPTISIFIERGIVEEAYVRAFCFGPAVMDAVAGAQMLEPSLVKLAHLTQPSPVVQRAELALQKTVQGSIGSDTRLMRLAVSNLVCDRLGSVVLGSMKLASIRPGCAFGHVGLRVCICVGQIYQQAMLDAHKLKALDASGCHLAESLVAPRSRLVNPSANAILLGWPRLSDLLAWLPSSRTNHFQLELASGQRDELLADAPLEDCNELSLAELDAVLAKKSQTRAHWKLLSSGMVVCSVARDHLRRQLDEASKWLYGATSTEQAFRKPAALITCICLRLNGICSDDDLACIEAAVRCGAIRSNLTWSGVRQEGKCILDVLEMNVATAAEEMDSYSPSAASTLNGAIVLGRIDVLRAFAECSDEVVAALSEASTDQSSQPTCTANSLLSTSSSYEASDSDME